MNYYYDVLLNFFDTNLAFYEWNEEDSIEYYKRIPLFAVSNKVLKDFINNDIKVSQEFLTLIDSKAKKKGECSKYIAIFADRNGSIALEFDKDGSSISRSFLEVHDDLNISELLYSLDVMNIKYKIVKKLEYDFNLREELNMKKIIKTELINLEKNKKYSKLKYLYMELFNKEPIDSDKIVANMVDKINEGMGPDEKRIYDLIKLSYNKV